MHGQKIIKKGKTKWRGGELRIRSAYKLWAGPLPAILLAISYSGPFHFTLHRLRYFQRH